MLDHQYRDGSRALARFEPISAVLRIAPEGLTLGAGTVLLPADAPRQLRSPKGYEARLLTLLAAAYGRAVNPAVLGNIERAARAWNEGDDCLAYIHLAHSRLGELPYPHEAARRLVIVDAFLKAGGSPRTVFKGLQLDAPYIDALEKEYNEAEPRVPPGSGKPSGEWTRDGEAAKPPVPSFVPRVGAPAASSLGELAPPAAVALGRFALPLITGAGGAVAAFGLLFIPSPNNIHVEGDVQGVPGLRYSWNRDESLLHFTYEGPDGGQRTFAAQLDGNGEFRDGQGRVVGRLLPGGNIAIDATAVIPGAANDNEPRLCPLPGPDKRGNEKGKDYADYVKSIVNPENPTPRYWGFQLPNPGSTGDLVHYDDCEHSTGTMIDAKDRYSGLLSFENGIQSVAKQFLAESKRQVDAAGTREVRWYFSEEGTADFAQALFTAMDKGRERIKIVWLPWPDENP